MSKEIRYWVGVVVLLVVLTGGLTQRGMAQENAGVTYENPLAYVGPDHNVYITDASGGVGTALTSDADDDPVQPMVEYRVSSWSPDGQTFIYVERFNSRLYLVPSGSPTTVLEDLLNNEFQTAWSSDGTQLAYFGQGSDLEVYTLAVDGGEPIERGNGLIFSIGEGPGLGLPEALLAKEQGRNEFTENRYLAWLPQGIFYGTYFDNSCIGAVIAQADDTLLCANQLVIPPFAISPDGNRIVGRTSDLPAPIEVTFTQGASDPAVAPKDAGLPAGAIPLAWGEDGLYYALSTDTRRVESQWQIEFGFEYTESTLTLWLSKLDGSPDTMIYTTQGYGIGRVALPPSDGLPLVVSIVTSDVPAAEAFNNGASLEEIEALRSHVEMVALQTGLENAEPLWTLLGGQPLYGRGNFTVVTPTE